MGLLSLTEIIIAAAFVVIGLVIAIPVFVYCVKRSKSDAGNQPENTVCMADCAVADNSPSVAFAPVFSQPIEDTAVAVAVEPPVTVSESAVQTINAQPLEEPVKEPVAVIREEVKAEPVVQEEVKAEPVVTVKEEIPPAQPAAAPIQTETPAPAPEQSVASTPVAAEEKPEEVKPKASVKKPVRPKPSAKIVTKKEDDWTYYDGDFEGYYYDPEDACYYEGETPDELKEKLAAKRAQIEEEEKKTGKKIIIKSVAPPFATLKTPKHDRKLPKKAEGFDESVIYGKYVIEHVGDEYFYTLYNNKDVPIYLSGNYAGKEYCEKAIKRFKTHIAVGAFSIESDNGKFNFVLSRKTYNHRGALHSTREAAQRHATEVKKYALTDIIREQ